MQKYTAQELLSPQGSNLLDEIVLLLSHSFTKDAATKWLLSNHERDAFVAAIPIYLRTVVRLALLSDATTTVISGGRPVSSMTQPHGADDSNSKEPQIQLPLGSTIQAVSIVVPPHGNANFDSTWGAYNAGVLSLPYHLGVGFCWRLFSQFLPNMHKMSTEVFPDPATRHEYWHLLFLATHPDSQGQGLGKKLLSDIQESVKKVSHRLLQQAKANQPLYLEASNTNNKRLYNRVGFEDRAEMVYGAVDEGESLRTAPDGKVLGGKVFGMVWTPPKDGTDRQTSA